MTKMSVTTSRAGYFQPETLSAALPIWNEYFSGLDWVALRYSPVYYGLGIPRGDGSAVVLVPGFMASDIYLSEMACWLRRIGYRAYLSNIGRNADCTDLLTNRLLETIERAYQQTGRSVHLIGHSLGGILSRAAAVQRPEIIASVTTMGSPFRGIVSHPLVLRASERVRRRIQARQDPQIKPGCFTGACNCQAGKALGRGLSSEIQQTAIYTKADGIVDWNFCITGEPSCDFEVYGTHIGLAFNPMVYQIIAKRLALATAQARLNNTQKVQTKAA